MLDSKSLRTRFFHGIYRLTFWPLPKRVVQLAFKAFTKRLHEIGDDFISVRKRPKSGAALVYAPIDPIPTPVTLRWGIVVQGPLRHEDDFTLETVRHYRRNAPEALVVVSTWEGEDEACLQRIRELGAHVVTSRKPAAVGRSNVNLQAVSSQRGLEYVHRSGCTHACKTRTDHRFYAIQLMPALAEMIDSFPIVGHDRPRRRLVALSRWTPKYYPLLLSDLFMFGQIDDLLEYWSPPPDELQLSHAEFVKLLKDMKRTSEFHQTPEQYLFYSYLKTIGETPEWTLEYWWKVLAERFVIIDPAMLDFYWPKYLPHTETAEMMHEGNATSAVVRWLDWLRLYALMKPDTNIQFPETDLDIRGPVPLQLRTGEFAKTDRAN